MKNLNNDVLMVVMIHELLTIDFGLEWMKFVGMLLGF
jgi:hypothetical protein